MELLLSRIHARKSAPSTKLAHNTYGRVTWESHDRTFEARIRYHDTDIITVWYTDIYEDDLTVLSVMIDTDGWNTVTTVRRVNTFFEDNGLEGMMFTHRGEPFLMRQSTHLQASRERMDRKFPSYSAAFQHYNLFDSETDQGVILYVGED